MIALFAISVASSAVTIRSHWFALSSSVMSSGLAMAFSLLVSSVGSGGRWLLLADAELAHQGEHVRLEPARDDLPARDPAERDLAEVDASVRCGNAEQLTSVRP